ncbi:hypothetical protein GGR56DRAFT_161108 [Xylariaceae sp. FL0804]|nr:hypothetical protein GGR56DRAFT_161108 [Xylariaceae sp. FL0804]
MSPRLKPLMLPQLVDERRRREGGAQVDAFDGEVLHYVYTTDSSSSGATSPVTPNFPRGHLRYSSSMSSFDLATPPGLDDLPPSPKQLTQTSSKRILDDVEEKPFEYDYFDDYDLDYEVDNDDLAD